MCTSGTSGPTRNGDLGPVYGVQWRSWPAPTADDPDRTIDQISNVLELIKHNPDSRRMVVTAWNPAEVENMALPPCHALFQFYVPMADSAASCTSVRVTCSSACRSTSPAIRCSR